MSYRCQACGAHVDGPMRRHVVRKPSGDIASEVPACAACLKQLRDGTPLASLLPQAPKRASNAVEPEYEGPRFG